MGWRDVYDVAVRWRQHSEPFDPVFYVDGMTHTGFEEGFGLQTPMVSGHQRVTRYFSEVRVPLAPSCSAVVVVVKRVCVVVYVCVSSGLWGLGVSWSS